MWAARGCASGWLQREWWYTFSTHRNYPCYECVLGEDHPLASSISTNIPWKMSCSSHKSQGGWHYTVVSNVSKGTAASRHFGLKHYRTWVVFFFSQLRKAPCFMEGRLRSMVCKLGSFKTYPRRSKGAWVKPTWNLELLPRSFNFAGT